MTALLTLLVLTLLRLVIPFGLLLLIGTLVERREALYRRLA
ncbi:MAG TPA: hypothetical protein VI793_05440 [Anaerolineales bacterium]|nr:hypothetical protein [Anaerolineales bacterium]